MTTRTHETIRVGLRRIIRDASVKPNLRMDAIKMLMRVEGLMGEARPPKNKPEIARISSANNNELQELLELAEEEKSV